MYLVVLRGPSFQLIDLSILAYTSRPDRDKEIQIDVITITVYGAVSAFLSAPLDDGLGERGNGVEVGRPSVEGVQEARVVGRR